jgi:hypothetical protein
MKIKTRLLSLSFFALCSVLAARSEETVTVTACQLKNTPPAFHHVLVDVSGFVSHGFEDFTLFDPTCPSWLPGFGSNGAGIPNPARCIAVV